jgi:ATP-dependent Clp protease protease subunit
MGRPSRNCRMNSCNEQQEIPDIMQQIYQQQNDRILYLSGDVTENTISQVIAGILSMAGHNKEKPITLVISTYGGSVDEMFSLYDILKYVPCPVRTVGIGKVMSAGVLLLSAGEKGKRLIGSNARLMIHGISAGISGNVFDIVNQSTECVRQQELMVKLLCKETGINKIKLNKMMKTGMDNYVTPEMAVNLGIVDKIIGV